MRLKFRAALHLDVLGELDQLDWDAAFFVERISWETKPEDTQILYLEGDDEIEDVVEGTHLPKLVNERGMRQLLDVETFRDVVRFERKRKPDATVRDVIYALNYYREKDDFYDPK